MILYPPNKVFISFNLYEPHKLERKSFGSVRIGATPSEDEDVIDDEIGCANQTVSNASIAVRTKRLSRMEAPAARRRLHF